MKKVSSLIVVLSLCLSGCMGQYVDPATGTSYNVMLVPKALPDGRISNSVRYELVPAAFISPDEQAHLLNDWGFKSSDQVQILTLDGDFEVVEDGIMLAAIPLSFSPSPEFGTNPGNLSEAARGDCRAFALHMIKRVTQDGMTWALLGSLINDIGLGLVTPTVVGVNETGTQAIVKMIYKGVNIVLIIGKSLSPTLFPPTNADKVSSLFRGITKFHEGKTFVNISTSASAFMRCVKDNWPKTQQELEKAKADHDKRYGRETGAVPSDFPQSIPVPDEKGNVIKVDFSSAALITPEGIEKSTREEIETLLVLGVIVIAAVSIPATGGVPTITLVWATQLAH